MIVESSMPPATTPRETLSAAPRPAPPEATSEPPTTTRPSCAARSGTTHRARPRGTGHHLQGAPGFAADRRRCPCTNDAHDSTTTPSRGRTTSTTLAVDIRVHTSTGTGGSRSSTPARDGRSPAALDLAGDRRPRHGLEQAEQGGRRARDGNFVLRDRLAVSTDHFFPGTSSGRTDGMFATYHAVHVAGQLRARQRPAPR